MTTTKPPPKKEKNKFIAHIRKDWLTYAALLLALFALLWTWSHQLDIEADIREEYQDYIAELREACGWNTYNLTISETFKLPEAEPHGTTP